jgi:protein O-mannosyl-transferase
MTLPPHSRRKSGWLLLAILAITAFVYAPGLTGGWLFDDFPNIVENPGVQPSHIDVASLTRAALSSPSSQFKRPLSSLSFAANFLIDGLHPFGWKLVNLIIHLLNGLLLYLLARRLLTLTSASHRARPSTTGPPGSSLKREELVALCITAAWLLLPINLTGVLYVVQRMESLANLFVLLGLIGYINGRGRMLGLSTFDTVHAANPSLRKPHGLLLSATSIIACTVVGALAKETTVMLPLYAFLVEWIVFGFQRTPPPARQAPQDAETQSSKRADPRILVLFLAVLVIPMLAGLSWLIPHVLSPDSWATRDFTLRTRLLSEARIVVGYIAWSLLALPHWLSFYHDDYHVSTGLLSPWTTAASIAAIAAMLAMVFVLRRRYPLAALGIALFLGCHVLTATILPLELVYEHRNYFASIGLLLASVPMFVVSPRMPFGRLRIAIFVCALLFWTSMTATTAYAWGNPLRLARELASRAPDSPRAQYELGRSYIVASHYDPDSVYTPQVYAPLERAAKLPDSSILPQQALIFFNARMHRPIKEAWWNSLIASLKRRKPGVQDGSSLAALTRCAREGLCPLSEKNMQAAFEAAVSHPDTDARIWAYYGDYAWNVMGKHDLGLRQIKHAVAANPDEPAYHITLARMLLAQGDIKGANDQIQDLIGLNIGGRLDNSIAALQSRIRNTGNTNGH